MIGEGEYFDGVRLVIEREQGERERKVGDTKTERENKTEIKNDK